MGKPLTAEDYAWRAYDLAHEYQEQVLSGQIITGDLVWLAVDRQRNDMAADGAIERGYYFDESRVMRVFRFFSMLKHWKGELAGTQFLLDPWQAFITWCLFGWLRQVDDGRRFSEAYVQVGKKNGKTLWAAGIGYYMFAADGEGGAEVYTAATTRDQAKLSHTDAVQMRQQSKALISKHDYYKASDTITNPSTGARFQPLGKNRDSLDGKNPHCVIADEIHRHPDGSLVSMLKYSMTTRKQPLMLEITTAGDDPESFCFEQREWAEQVVRGAVSADEFFAFVAEPNRGTEDKPGDDWKDERSWYKGNPGLGSAKPIERMRERFAKAEHVESEALEFRRYDVNQWVVGSLASWIPDDQWAACPDYTKPMPAKRPCFAGLDLAATQDVCAAALYWPATAEDPLAHVMLRFWIPGDQVKARAEQYKVPLKAWIENGWVRTTPGATINTDLVVGELLRWREHYNVQELGYDDWAANDPIRALEAGGYREEQLVPLPQTTKTFNAAMVRMEEQVSESRLCHGHNPAMRWMMANVRVIYDMADRKKPVKRERNRHRKIDGPVAMLCAVARQMTQDDAAGGSVYDQRGLIDLAAELEDEL